jgi:hypothetical protein
VVEFGGSAPCKQSLLIQLLPLLEFLVQQCAGAAGFAVHALVGCADGSAGWSSSSLTAAIQLCAALAMQSSK